MTEMSLAQARKYFHDWLDEQRPWAHPGVDVYEMMEQMVDAAARYFRGEVRPTTEQIRKLTEAIEYFSSTHDQHPVDYDGPCNCAECRSSE